MYSAWGPDQRCVCVCACTFVQTNELHVLLMPGSEISSQLFCIEEQWKGGLGYNHRPWQKKSLQQCDNVSFTHPLSYPNLTLPSPIITVLTIGISKGLLWHQPQLSASCSLSLTTVTALFCIWCVSECGHEHLCYMFILICTLGSMHIVCVCVYMFVFVSCTLPSCSLWS